MEPYEEIDPAMTAGLGIFMFVSFIFLIVIIAAMWKTFVKAGKPGWAAIIPIYNTIVLLEITGKPLWWIILMFIPIVNIIVGIMVLHELSLSFGQGVGMTILLILLPIVGWPMIGFGDARYLGPQGGATPATA